MFPFLLGRPPRRAEERWITKPLLGQEGTRSPVQFLRLGHGEVLNRIYGKDHTRFFASCLSYYIDIVSGR